MEEEQSGNMTTLKGGTLKKKKTRCFEIHLTFSQALKHVMSFTHRVQCLSQFGFVHYESQPFI